MCWTLLIAMAWAADPPESPPVPVPPEVTAPAETPGTLGPIVVVSPTMSEVQAWVVGPIPGAPGHVAVPLSIPLSGHYDEHGGWVNGAWTPPPPSAPTAAED